MRHGGVHSRRKAGGMRQADGRVFRVLFLCTGNSARSQIAEALLNQKGAGRFVAESAGSNPAARVNPYAIDILRQNGLEWRGHAPRGMDGLESKPWDFVITVCDRAKEACPFFPASPFWPIGGCPTPPRFKAEMSPSASPLPMPSRSSAAGSICFSSSQ